MVVALLAIRCPSILTVHRLLKRGFEPLTVAVDIGCVHTGVSRAEQRIRRLENALVFFLDAFVARADEVRRNVVREVCHAVVHYRLVHGGRRLQQALVLVQRHQTLNCALLDRVEGLLGSADTGELSLIFDAQRAYHLGRVQLS